MKRLEQHRAISGRVRARPELPGRIFSGLYDVNSTTDGRTEQVGRKHSSARCDVRDLLPY